MGPPLITGGSFDILQDEACPRRQFPPPAHADPHDALRELPVLQGHNQGPASALEPAPTSKLAQHRRPPRHRRPPVDFETFEPLDAVIEETSITEDQEPPASVKSQGSHPLASLDRDPNVPQQVAKHLAGQFKWLMVYPAPTGDDASPDQGHTGSSGQNVVYGCNFLRRKPRGHPADQDDARPHSYTFVATPFKDMAFAPADMDGLCERAVMASAHPQQCPGRSLKATELVELVERALSPSPSSLSDGGCSNFAHGSPHTGPSSHSRIEDSFEELDKLEDELEAVDAATLPRAMIPPTEKGFIPSPTTPCTRRTSCTIGKDAAATQPSTVRIKPCEKTKPKARRAGSLTLRAEKADEAGAATEARGTPSRDKPKALPTTPQAATKSLKPLTVPRFELPGDAVARRLREQRLARQAQQAEAQQKARTCSPKPKVRRPLTKPTFELPGEAISRRKKEEREARLRAEEEEHRKKREFKARPMRQSVGHATLPRATAASRARQARLSQEETEVTVDKTRRASTGLSRAKGTGPDGFKSLPGRTRGSVMLAPGYAYQATAASTSKRTTDDESGQRRRERREKEAKEQRGRGDDCIVSILLRANSGLTIGLRPEPRLSGTDGDGTEAEYRRSDDYDDDDDDDYDYDYDTYDDYDYDYDYTNERTMQRKPSTD
ncbi:hypothetical protein XA68_11456 [Ophiocordyceps unilateralis]|uniref:TPX2 C-terminal domain-containing protein n=1 Tax=Ophiocordyceps unilateralis TaxID=268505 RepID=A0A2A9PGE7_OPHUN|nr:hypothetical protein XA68_11456 [Ophiocordyceps unilateralis]